MDHNANIFLYKCKIVLTYFGIWMLPQRNIQYKCFTACLGFLHGGFLVCNLTHMAVVWGDLNKMSEGAYLLFTHMSNCYKCFNFVLRKHTFDKMLRSMDAKVFKSKSPEHDAIMIKHASRIDKMYNVWIISIFFVGVIWGVIPQLNKTEKILPFNIWMPGDTQTSPSYEISYAIQMLMIINISQLSLAVDVIFIQLLMFLCSQMKMIMVDSQKIQNIPPGLSINEKNELIKRNNQILIDCISQHQAATRFLNDLADMFHIAIFFQMTGSIMIVCIIMIHISAEPPNTMHFFSTLIYFMLILTQLFMYCWSGHELTDTSEQLRDRLYFCPWYDCDIRFRRTLFIAMECLKRPMVFHAGHFITLSRPTYVSILRCSYSYYAVLNQAQ